MPEESKEEYIRRHRKAPGILPVIKSGEQGETPPRSLKQRLGSLLFIILFLLFAWTIYEIFGMMKSN